MSRSLEKNSYHEIDEILWQWLTLKVQNLSQVLVIWGIIARRMMTHQSTGGYYIAPVLWLKVADANFRKSRAESAYCYLEDFERRRFLNLGGGH